MNWGRLVVCFNQLRQFFALGVWNGWRVLGNEGDGVGKIR